MKKFITNFIYSLVFMIIALSAIIVVVTIISWDFKFLNHLLKLDIHFLIIRVMLIFSFLIAFIPEPIKKMKS